MLMGRYFVGAMLVVVAVCALVPSGISQRKRITKEQLIRSCKPGRRERKPAASYIVMFQKQGIDFSPTVEDEVDIRAACRYLGERELAELIAAIRYQYELQEVLAKAQAFLYPSPSPSPSPPSTPTPTPTPVPWARSDEAKKLAQEMINEVEALADEGRVMDLSDHDRAVKSFAAWVDKCSVVLGRIDIKMRKFNRTTYYKFDWDMYDRSVLKLSDKDAQKRMFRNEVNRAILELDTVKAKINTDAAISAFDEAIKGKPD